MTVQKVVVLSVRLTARLKESVDKTADESGLTTLDWIRAVLARAANEGAFAPRKGKGGRDARKRRA